MAAAAAAVAVAAAAVGSVAAAAGGSSGHRRQDGGGGGCLVHLALKPRRHIKHMQRVNLVCCILVVFELVRDESHFDLVRDSPQHLGTSARWHRNRNFGPRNLELVSIPARGITAYICIYMYTQMSSHVLSMIHTF